MITLPELAQERSTYPITITFRVPGSVTVDNPSGDNVTPGAVTWSLRDSAGNVVNSRTAVSLTPASSIRFFLTGADLQIFDSTQARERRVVTIEATYTDSGSKAVKEEIEFEVENLLGVTT